MSGSTKPPTATCSPRCACARPTSRSTCGSPDEKKDEARDKAREEARKRLEDQQAKSREPIKPLPEFGTTEDFQLMQAINQLKGQAGRGEQGRWSNASAEAKTQ